MDKFLSPWVSARACNNSACVQIQFTEDGGARVRDSKNPGNAPLEFDASEWSAFLDGAKAGEFDSRQG